MLMSSYQRGFWNDRGTWVLISIVASLLVIWIAKIVVGLLWDLLDAHRRDHRSKRDLAIKAGGLILVLFVPIALASASVNKAVFENQRWQRHRENERIAAGLANDFSTEKAVGNKAKATVLFCLLDSVDDWAVFGRGDEDAIAKFLLDRRSDCIESAPTQSEVNRLEQVNSSGGFSPKTGEDCDIVCVPTPGQDNYISEPSNDPCEGFNICTEGPNGRYGEDWINDPWDEPNDGR